MSRRSGLPRRRMLPASARLRVSLTALSLTAIGLSAGSVAAPAQDVEPRALSPAPGGTNVLGVALASSWGDVLLDKTLPAEDLDGTIVSLIPSYTRYFNVFGTSARVSAALPFATGSWDATVLEAEPVETDISRTGLGDGVVNATVFLLGAPAMTREQFRDYRRKTILGFNLRVKLPIGQYDSEKLVNLGSNRWQLAPALGLSQWFGRFAIEAVAAAWLFSDNTALLGDNVLSQEALWAFQLIAGYSFKPNLWLSAGVRQSAGGRTTLNGVKRDDPTENTRLGIVLGIPIATGHTLKLVGTTGIRTTAGNDFDTLVAQWLYAW